MAPVSFRARVAIITMVIFSGIIGCINYARAAFVQNDSEGFFNVDFQSNQQGVAAGGSPVLERNNISVDTFAGNLQLQAGQASGHLMTTSVTPTSFSAWGKVVIDATYSNSTDVLVSLYDCAGTPNPVVGYQNMTLDNNGEVDISALSIANGCLRPRIELAETVSSPRPLVDNFRITWSPLPVFLTNVLSNPTQDVGETLTYSIRYSVSYASSAGVVVWVPIPRVATSTVTTFTPAYAQSPNPTFVAADNGGVFTASAVTVQGISIPADSIYFDLGTVAAGTSGIVNLQIKSASGLENGIQYLLQSFMDSQTATLVSSAVETTTLTSVPYPIILKSVQGAVTIGTSKYITNSAPYSKNVSYQILIKNKPIHKLGHETIFNPVVTDTITDVQLIKKILNEQFGEQLDSTGYFNVEMREALKRFQIQFSKEIAAEMYTITESRVTKEMKDSVVSGNLLKDTLKVLFEVSLPS